MALILGGFYMYNQQYKMAIFVTPESEDDPEWPNKRKWFDASKWLKNSKYIKINEFYLLNIQYIPIRDLHDFSITLALQESIKDSVNLEPKIIPLSKLDNQIFYKEMEKNLSYEYLRTEFNSNTLEPTGDFFLIFFTYKNEKYEVELLRTPYKGGFIFLTQGSFVHKAGHWHSVSPKDYSYRDYLAGKPIK